MFEQIIDKLSTTPRLSFLIDGLGALLSAFLLGVVLTNFERYFGMPHQALYILAFLPCLFAIYDFICYFQFPKNWRLFLKIIAIANLLYCCLSVGFLFQHYPQLTGLGWLYFILELILVIVIALVELRVAARP